MNLFYYFKKDAQESIQQIKMIRSQRSRHFAMIVEKTQ